MNPTETLRRLRNSHFKVFAFFFYLNTNWHFEKKLNTKKTSWLFTSTEKKLEKKIIYWFYFSIKSVLKNVEVSLKSHWIKWKHHRRRAMDSLLFDDWIGQFLSPNVKAKGFAVGNAKFWMETFRTKWITFVTCLNQVEIVLKDDAFEIHCKLGPLIWRQFCNSCL